MHRDQWNKIAQSRIWDRTYIYINVLVFVGMNLNKTKYLCIGETYSNLKLDKDSEIESCQEYKYLGVIFDTSGTDDKVIRSRVIQARKCIACVNGILWSEDIRKERKFEHL